MFYVTRRARLLERAGSRPPASHLGQLFSHLIHERPVQPAAIMLQQRRRNGDCGRCLLRPHETHHDSNRCHRFRSSRPLRFGPQGYRSIGAATQRLGLNLFALPSAGARLLPSRRPQSSSSPCGRFSSFRCTPCGAWSAAAVAPWRFEESALRPRLFLSRRALRLSARKPPRPFALPGIRFSTPSNMSSLWPWNIGTSVRWASSARRTFQVFVTTTGQEIVSQIVFVCSDIWEPYLKLIREKCSEALHILDRFRIVANMNKALDRVRAEEA